MQYGKSKVNCSNSRMGNSIGRELLTLASSSTHHKHSQAGKSTAITQSGALWIASYHPPLPPLCPLSERISSTAMLPVAKLSASLPEETALEELSILKLQGFVLVSIRVHLLTACFTFQGIAAFAPLGASFVTVHQVDRAQIGLVFHPRQAQLKQLNGQRKGNV